MLKFKYQWDKNGYDINYIAASTNSSRIFICNHDNYHVDIYDLHGTFIHKIGNVNIFGVYDPNRKPHRFYICMGIYIDDANQELYIPDICSIKVFDLQGRHLRSIQTTLDYPHLVYCSYNGEKIFVANEHWFKIYNGKTGRILVNKDSLHINKNNIDIGIGYIYGIVYNNITREVFISNSQNIIVLDEHGEFKRIFNWGRNHYRHQLCIDELNNILFIINCTNQCVSVLRCSDGSLLYNIYMDDICGIYYDSTYRHLYMHDTHVIKVYSYNES